MISILTIKVLSSLTKQQIYGRMQFNSNFTLHIANNGILHIVDDDVLNVLDTAIKIDIDFKYKFYHAAFSMGRFLVKITSTTYCNEKHDKYNQGIRYD
jgi:hypothetical protein